MSLKTRHLASVRKYLWTAENHYNDLMENLEDIPTTNIISCLIDNRAVMQSSSNGVESRLRRNHTNLLDISGDAVRMVSIAKKKFCLAFGRYLEDICQSLYYDIIMSLKSKKQFGELCDLLGISRADSLIRLFFFKMFTNKWCHWTHLSTVAGSDPVLWKSTDKIKVNSLFLPFLDKFMQTWQQIAK